MRLFIIFIFSILLLSNCEPIEEPDPLPRAILININAKNEMETPVTIKIRHKYAWYRYYIYTPYNVGTVYSDWITEKIEADEERLIGEETPYLISYSDEEAKTRGFVLLDDRVSRMLKNGTISLSSFDLKIETEYGSTFVTGFEDVSELFEVETDLCVLRIRNPYNTCFIGTYRQYLRIFSSFFGSVLTANLIIKQDGFWSFEHDPVENRNGIFVVEQFEDE